jgi:hypothetical protein
LADPRPRCLLLDHCSNDAECPRGAVCNNLGSCVAQKTRSSDETALIAGFETQPMVADLDVDESGATLSWVAPFRSVEIVRCVLFTCAPVIESQMGLLRIVNYDKCAYVETDFAVLQGVFDLGQTHLRFLTPEQSDARCDNRAPKAPAIVSDLLAGCWAFDQTSLVAASRLRSVPPAGVSPFATIPRDATCATNGDQCYDSETDRFGTCYAQSCRLRCLQDFECAVVAPETPFKCLRVDPVTPLGVCVPDDTPAHSSETPQTPSNGAARG